MDTTACVCVTVRATRRARLGTLAFMIYDPKHRDAEAHLRSLIRRGSIDFDAIVTELKTHTFIDDRHPEMALTRPGFNIFDSDEFDTLFGFFYPGQEQPMQVLAFGVPMPTGGDIIYALYDGKRISTDELTKLVRAKYAT